MILMRSQIVGHESEGLCGNGLPMTFFMGVFLVGLLLVFEVVDAFAVVGTFCCQCHDDERNE